MQEAIRSYINLNKENMSLFEMDEEIDKVKKSEIERERKKQLRQWRKLNK
jgi:hypothetical protein